MNELEKVKEEIRIKKEILMDWMDSRLKRMNELETTRDYEARAWYGGERIGYANAINFLREIEKMIEEMEK